MFNAIDFAILKLTMRVSHYIDERWHINNYQIARWFLIIGSICSIAVPILFFLPKNLGGDPKWNFIILPVNALIAWTYLMKADKLKVASEKWEKNPTTVPLEAMIFLIMPNMMRIVALLFTIMIMIPLGATIIFSHPEGIIIGLLTWVSRLWLFFGDCVAQYFASIPPSRRKRKEKKVTDWSFGMTPQPMRS